MRVIRGLAAPVALGLTICTALGLLLARSAETPGVFDGAPLQQPTDGYVSSETCFACHPQQYATWYASYHRTMTQLATPSAVAAPDAFTPLPLDGHDYAFSRSNDGYWLDLALPGRSSDSSQQIRRQAVLTTGSHHMQAYWYANGRGRTLGLFPWVYLIEDQRWVPRRSVFLRPPSMDRSLEVSRWNITCIRCHTTYGQPRHVGLREFDSRVAELGISCQSCHGPGAEHVAENRAPWRRYRNHRQANRSQMVHPERIDPRRSAEICGQCHGILEFPSEPIAEGFFARGPQYRPGDTLTDTRLVFRLADIERNPRLHEIHRRAPEFAANSFWSDGQVRVSGREYNGLIESPCFDHDGPAELVMTCGSCHSMHPQHDGPQLQSWRSDQLRDNAASDGACLQCHTELSDPQRRTAHTRHADTSSGSRCYNCHMPYTNFGLLKAIRSHTVGSPSVAATLETGRPNACNLCHLDQTLGWTADKLARWFGQSPPAIPAVHEHVPASLVWLLQGDAGQRALAAWSMGWAPAVEASEGERWIPRYLAELLDDPYDAVRYVTLRSLRTYANYHEFDADHLAPAAQQQQLVSVARATWERRTGQPLAQRELVSQLEQARDDRPIFLQE